MQEPAKGNHEMIGTPPQTETTTEMRVTETTTEMENIKTPTETTTEMRGTKTTTEMNDIQTPTEIKVIETAMKLYSVITTPTVNKHRHNHGVHQHRKSLKVMEKAIF